ncbi:MAG TPA: serine/threonine-protein kinase [Thermoanaerobaculia bacterium]|nr:serine/threonine-protein kinase [Thermoanaerobaculia bacterium]
MLEKIGKYEVSEQIGVGGFGAVYRGRDPFIKRTVAIKTCSVNDEEIKHRFFREAELAGNLHHRNITTIYDFGVENGIPYIVQEFLTGEDLDKKIKRGEALPLARKVEILVAIAEGLGYAHNASIIHRDVKPANVRVLDDGTVKVMDFGIAKSLQTESNLTQTGITLGTSAYLAPEQIRGEAIDRRTDVFAMGVLSYELLTYRKPFRGEHLSTILYKILNESPEKIESLAPEVPPALVAIVNRALAKNPAERYATMDEFRRDLQNVGRELGGLSGRYPVTQVLPDTVRAARLDADEDPTLATPSSGVAPLNITPPSGALARVPAPDATPTSGAISGGARPPLELVNFRDPAAEEVAPEATTTGPRLTTETTGTVRKTRLTILAALLILGVAGAEIYRLLNREPAAAAKPAPAPAATAHPPVPTAALEFPEPKLGEGEAAKAASAPMPTAAPPAAPAAAPAAAAPPAPAPPAEKPAPAKKYRIQFSSVPVATLSVDGKVVGPSVPARSLMLDEGEHTVRYEAKGFPVHERKFTVGPKSEDRIHYQFPVSMLVIEAPQWAGANVLVDGKFRGTLPGSAHLPLAAGTYTVTLSREGMNPATERITVTEGAPKTWTAPPPSPASPGAN